MNLIKHSTFIALIIFGSLVSADDNATIDSSRIQLTLSPKGCVALRKGQVCYQKTELKWQHPKRGNYCLIQLSNKSVLQCWNNQNQGRYAFDFQSTQDEEYVLAVKDSQQIIKRTNMLVSWVFKSSKRPKSSWRLF